MAQKKEDVDKFLKGSGLDTAREKEIGQHIGYRYDVNLVPDYSRVTPFLKKYMETMGWRMSIWVTRRAGPPSSTGTSMAG